MKLRIPHSWVLLSLLIVVAAAATWFLAPGEYTRVAKEGRQIVDPASFHPVPANPAGVMDVLLSFPRGLVEVAPIVFYIFILGGAFGVIDRSGAITAGIDAVVRQMRGRGELVIIVLMLVFAIAGGTIGMAEETLPFLPALVLLAGRLGYDRITGGAIALVGAGAGFSGAFLNPFTVGVAQGIAGLPLFSGIGFRLVVWSTLTVLAILHVVRHARQSSADRVAAEENELATDSAPLGWRQKAVLGVVVLSLAGVVIGACPRSSRTGADGKEIQSEASLDIGHHRAPPLQVRAGGRHGDARQRLPVSSRPPRVRTPR